ncbi:hypothetical protein HMPREF0578_1229 [Mobiluncus mulieris 28-1]|uniref:Uncharacterized protein n=1 Tax=Mobiluncus mulieris ATCC 35239 TaxID=871571 RepID=E0QRD5_9ACTO|nr:hypothetical protein HMPREF0578_1229 [Mobiluncus mulieris 28-1]EFM45643.1 hypothetical protein HMPREF0580_1450 [Mobiluncus mulieris ATCC 35239]
MTPKEPTARADHEPTVNLKQSIQQHDAGYEMDFRARFSSVYNSVQAKPTSGVFLKQP